MKRQQFELMIEQSGLRHIITMSYQLRFVVSLHVPIEIPLEEGGCVQSLRVQCDTLAFGRQEFEAMNESQARAHITACISRLAQAARTQQGVMVYSEPVAQTPTKKPAIATVQAIGYPAH